MTKLLEGLKLPFGRRRELRRARRGYPPGLIDIRDESPEGFLARPNFYYFEWLEGKLLDRPAYLPLYPCPRMVDGQALNAFSGSQVASWPSELGLDEPIGASRDWIRVVGQYVATAEDGPGAILQNEHVLGGWLRGSFETSAVWNLVVVPSLHINPIRHQANPTCYLPGLKGAYAFLAWGNDLWLGNTGLRKHLLVGADAALNPTGRLW